MSSPEIRPYRAGDEEAILTLYERCFGIRQSLAQWHWRFRDLPTGEAVIHLAWRGRVCVGQFACSPMPLALDDAPIDAWVALDGMVHPEHRQGGLFSELEAGIGEEMRERGPRYGFPNDKSYPLFVGPMGWRTPGRPRVHMKLMGTKSLRRRSRLLALLGPGAAYQRGRDRAARQSIELRQFSRFEELGDRLAQLAPTGRIHLRRTPEALDWRFRAGPHPYRLYSAGATGDEWAFAVVRVQERFGLRIAWLADLGAVDGAPFAQLLRAVAADLSQDADLFAALLPHPDDRSLLRKAGFLAVPERTLPHPFYLIVRDGGSAFESLDRWHLTWGLHDAV